MPNPIPGFPDETNTGVPDGTNLTQYTGPMSITEDGTVIENKIIDGSLRVTAANVTIVNSEINYDGTGGVDAEGADNITIKDSTLVGPGTGGISNSAILGSGNFIGNDISNAENGISLVGGSSTVQGNYIHDLNAAGSDPHYDGISVQGGQDGVLIQNNTIAGRDTSDIFIKDDFGPINDVTVDHNLLIGDPGYNVYVDGRADGGPITDVAITDNYVQEGFYGAYSVDESSPDIAGNVEFAKGDAPDVETPSDPVDTMPPPTETPDNPIDTTPPPAEDTRNDDGFDGHFWGFHRGGHDHGRSFDFGSWRDAADDSAHGGGYAWVSDFLPQHSNHGESDYHQYAMNGHCSDDFTV